MTTTNVDAMVNALAAPVTWLATQTAWTALGVHEFWSWRGDILPRPQEGEPLPSDKLPALVARVQGARQADERTSDYDVLQISIEGMLVYPTQTGTNDYPADACLRALMVLRDSLTSVEARRTLWSAPTAVGGFEFDVGGVDLVTEEGSDESIQFAVGLWSLRIDQILPHAR